MFLEFKLDYYKTLIDLEVRVAELEKAVGMRLEKGGENNYEN